MMNYLKILILLGGLNLKEYPKLVWVFILLQGNFFLSLELLMVKIIQSLEKIDGSYFKDIFRYFKIPIIYIPIYITAGIILVSIYMLFKETNYNKKP